MRDHSAMSAPWSLTHEQYDAAYPPTLRTGCEGAFRVEDDSDPRRPVTTRCDGCGMLLGVKRSVFDAGVPSPVTPELLPTGEPF